MHKDILIDNCVVCNFCNPVDDDYKELIKWLFNEGELVVTQKLIIDYHSACAASPSDTSIIAIMAKLTSDGRLRKFNKKELSNFRIKKHIHKKFLCNEKDVDLIKAVMLSFRKYALSLDDNLVRDINNYPGHEAHAAASPEDLPYK